MSFENVSPQEASTAPIAGEIPDASHVDAAFIPEQPEVLGQRIQLLLFDDPAPAAVSTEDALHLATRVENTVAKWIAGGDLTQLQALANRVAKAGAIRQRQIVKDHRLSPRDLRALNLHALLQFASRFQSSTSVARGLAEFISGKRRNWRAPFCVLATVAGPWSIKDFVLESKNKMEKSAAYEALKVLEQAGLIVKIKRGNFYILSPLGRIVARKLSEDPQGDRSRIVPPEGGNGIRKRRSGHSRAPSDYRDSEIITRFVVRGGRPPLLGTTESSYTEAVASVGPNPLDTLSVDKAGQRNYNKFQKKMRKAAR